MAYRWPDSSPPAQTSPTQSVPATQSPAQQPALPPAGTNSGNGHSHTVNQQRNNGSPTTAPAATGGMKVQVQQVPTDQPTAARTSISSDNRTPTSTFTAPSVATPSSANKVPVQRSLNCLDVLRDGGCNEAYGRWLQFSGRLGIGHVRYWRAVEKVKRLPVGEEKRLSAKRIYEEFLAANCPQPVVIPASEQMHNRFDDHSSGRIIIGIFDQHQEQVFKLLQSHYDEFKRSQAYQQMEYEKVLLHSARYEHLLHVAKEHYIEEFPMFYTDYDMFKLALTGHRLKYGHERDRRAQQQQAAATPNSSSPQSAAPSEPSDPFILRMLLESKNLFVRYIRVKSEYSLELPDSISQAVVDGWNVSRRTHVIEERLLAALDVCRDRALHRMRYELWPYYTKHMADLKEQRMAKAKKLGRMQQASTPLLRSTDVSPAFTMRHVIIEHPVTQANKGVEITSTSSDQLTINASAALTGAKSAMQQGLPITSAAASTNLSLLKIPNYDIATAQVTSGNTPALPPSPLLSPGALPPANKRVSSDQSSGPPSIRLRRHSLDAADVTRIAEQRMKHQMFTPTAGAQQQRPSMSASADTYYQQGSASPSSAGPQAPPSQRNSLSSSNSNAIMDQLHTLSLGNTPDLTPTSMSNTSNASARPRRHKRGMSGLSLELTNSAPSDQDASSDDEDEPRYKQVDADLSATLPVPLTLQRSSSAANSSTSLVTSPTTPGAEPVVAGEADDFELYAYSVLSGQVHLRRQHAKVISADDLDLLFLENGGRWHSTGKAHNAHLVTNLLAHDPFKVIAQIHRRAVIQSQPSPLAPPANSKPVSLLTAESIADVDANAHTYHTHHGEHQRTGSTSQMTPSESENVDDYGESDMDLSADDEEDAVEDAFTEPAANGVAGVSAREVRRERRVREGTSKRRSVRFSFDTTSIEPEVSPTQAPTPVNIHKRPKKSIIKKVIREESLVEVLDRVTKERAKETNQFLSILQRGTMLRKINSFGKAEKRWVWINSDGGEICWAKTDSKGTGKASGLFARKKSRPLADVLRVRYGATTAVRFHRYNADGHPAWLAFTVHFSDRSLDLVATNDDQVTSWFLGLQSLAPLSTSYLSIGALLWKRCRMKVRHLARLNRITPQEAFTRIVRQAQKDVSTNQLASPIYSFTAQSPILTQPQTSSLEPIKLNLNQPAAAPPNMPKTPTGTSSSFSTVKRAASMSRQYSAS